MKSIVSRLLAQFGLLLVSACATFVGTAAGSETTLPASTPAAREELTTVVRGQVAAFHAEDFAAALKFSAEKFRAQFDVEAFEKLVRKNYAVLITAKSCAPIDATDNSKEATLNVRVTGADDAVVYFRYFFVREDDAWRIVGVIPIPPPVTTTA